MSKSKQYRSRVMASVHETAEGLAAAGIVNTETMREGTRGGAGRRPMMIGHGSRIRRPEFHCRAGS